MKLLSIILLALLPLTANALNYEQRVRHITGNDLMRHFDLTDRSGTAAVDRSPVGTNGTYTNSPTLSDIVGSLLKADNQTPLVFTYEMLILIALILKNRVIGSHLNY